MKSEECVHCGNPDTTASLEYPIEIIGQDEDIHLEFHFCDVCHRVFTLDVATFNDYNGEAVTPDAVLSTLNSQIEKAIEEETNSEGDGL